MTPPAKTVQSQKNTVKATFIGKFETGFCRLVNNYQDSIGRLIYRVASVYKMLNSRSFPVVLGRISRSIRHSNIGLSEIRRFTTVICLVGDSVRRHHGWRWGKSFGFLECRKRPFQYQVKAKIFFFMNKVAKWNHKSIKPNMKKNIQDFSRRLNQNLVFQE